MIVTFVKGCFDENSGLCLRFHFDIYLVRLWRFHVHIHLRMLHLTNV